MKMIIKQWKFFILFSFILTACQSKTISLQTETLIDDDLNSVNVSESNHYEIAIELDSEVKSFTGEQKTSFTNTTGEDLTNIYFRLYPNAFKNFNDAPNLFFESNYTEESYVGGYIDIKSVDVNGKESVFLMEGTDDTLLRIELERALKDGDSLEIDLDYFVKLPTSMDRFGYNEETINFGNWYPVLSVYDDNGWSKDPYYALGDPFYTDIANYNVNLTVDEDIIVATSGNILSEDIRDGQKHYQIEGKLLRDFAFVTSPNFKIAEKMVGETAVRLYYSKGSRKVVKKGLQYAADSLETFNEQFGTYPYGSYSVVITDFSTGMEYPGLVYISRNYFNRRLLAPLEQVIVHETAHQWWYGLVGNDEVKEPWLDEGLTSYSEVLYMDNIYGRKQADNYYRLFFEEEYERMQEMLADENLIVNKPLNEFTDWADYGFLAYTKPAIFLNEIKEVYDQDTLITILSTYFDEYKYQNATTDDFLAICEEVTGDSFEAMNEQWLR